MVDLIHLEHHELKFLQLHLHECSETVIAMKYGLDVP